jgi:hypothetical protein
MSIAIEPIASWTIDGRNVWRVTLDTYQGQPVFHIREWFPAGGGEYRPGPKGLTMGTRQIDRLVNASTELKAEAERQGLPTA